MQVNHTARPWGAWARSRGARGLGTVAPATLPAYAAQAGYVSTIIYRACTCVNAGE